MSRPREHKFPKTLKRRMLKAAGSLCSICLRPLIMATAEPHHIIPVSSGGLTIQENGQIVCAPCHVGLHQKGGGNMRNKRDSLQIAGRNNYGCIDCAPGTDFSGRLNHISETSIRRYIRQGWLKKTGIGLVLTQEGYAHI